VESSVRSAFWKNFVECHALQRSINVRALLEKELHSQQNKGEKHESDRIMIELTSEKSVYFCCSYNISFEKIFRSSSGYEELVGGRKQHEINKAP
jgi:hypothetical protein